MKRTKLYLILVEKNILIQDLAIDLGITPYQAGRKINGKSQFKQKEINIILRKLKMKYEDVFVTLDEESYYYGANIR